MDLIGKEVVHTKYGSGRIKKYDGSCIFVSFDSVKGQKQFQYPTCFNSFMKFANANDDACMRAGLNSSGSSTSSTQAAGIHVQIAPQPSISAGGSVSAHSTKNRKRTDDESSGGYRSPRYSSVEDFCADYSRAISKEINFLRDDGGKRQRLTDGKYIEFKNGSYIYSFEADTELKYPDGTQIKLWRGQDSFKAAIEGSEDFIVIISSEEYLGDEVASIEFSAEPWQLLYWLNNRLDEIVKSHSSIVRELICSGKSAIDPHSKIVTGQQQAIDMSEKQPITFVWGPPGTGKTQTLARMALHHMTRRPRPRTVLMLSYSNVSVDGAMLRVVSLAEENKNNDLLEPGVLVR